MAREIENKVWELTKNGSFVKDFSLKDQINRSSGSVMDNIAEGFGRGSSKEFINFLIISRASAIELQSQLVRAFDRKHIDEDEFDHLTKEADAVIGSITNLIIYLKKDITKTFRKN